MPSFVKTALVALCLAAPASAQSVVILPNTDYTCQYILDNMESDEDLRVFMDNYAFGFVSGLNAQRSLQGETIVDFGRLDNAMIVTWSYEVCEASPGDSYPTALAKMFQIVLNQQEAQ